ncbi:ribonuclease T2 family protein [Sphingomonas sp.]|uniref:ribonuclease T2 family protein n=1 Tax=Sphingomonas sp. TaxID=28214 RepID=UPI002D803F70|nr:ribonuclease T [Sphingomonas sp.]HEU0044430.1 ribonuclease T [Sphingomonas sp.]
MKAAVLATAALLAPVSAGAQALRCAVPSGIDRPRPDRASPDQPRRVLPVAGYKLALTWSPQYCRSREGGFQCGEGNRFGFTLHGLWPDGPGREWPEYCAPAALLPDSVVRANICATPSAQLLQHEWAKHGTCMRGYGPVSYFARATGLYGKLRYPDMDALSRRRLKAGRLAAEMVRLNPGLAAEAIAVTTTRDGWLDEIWLCLDRRFRYVRCRPGTGVTPGSDIRIWRGRR